MHDVAGFVSDACAALQVTAVGRPVTSGASGARVVETRTRDGASAYLKSTVAAPGDARRDAAEREVRFYTELAPTLTVATPRLLDHLTDARGVAVLLADAGGHVEPRSWSDAVWSTLGRDLAELHLTPLSSVSWARPDPVAEAVAAADERTVRPFWSGWPEVERLIGDRRVTFDPLLGEPPVFVHGDCHAGNVLHDGRGQATLCDWQECGAGRAGGDLAFLRARTTPSGTAVPPGLLDSYLRRREELGVPAPEDFRRGVDLEELAILVLLWPAYAGFNRAAQNDRVRRRATRLSEQLQA